MMNKIQTKKLSQFYIDKAEKMPHALAYRTDMPFAQQHQAIRDKLTELLRMPEKTIEPHAIIEWTDQTDPRFDEIRFRFETEPDFFIPVHMLLPKNAHGNLPVMICLQGHSPGMHISLGRNDSGLKSKQDRDFALQAVARGYAAVAMEQRGFGELTTDIYPERGCVMPSVQALALGRTLLGERVYDVSRLIDVLSSFEMLSKDQIYMMGNSGGGTTSFYTMCVEDRVAAAMPSCFFGEFVHSFFGLPHCSCGFLPDFCKWFDIPDLVAAVAPRPLLLVAGEQDPISEITYVRSSYENKVKKIYEAAGVPNACGLVVGPEGHRFYASLAWPVFEEMIGRK